MITSKTTMIKPMEICTVKLMEIANPDRYPTKEAQSIVAGYSASVGAFPVSDAAWNDKRTATGANPNE